MPPADEPMTTRKSPSVTAPGFRPFTAKR
jgi:hypothetical protein